MTDQERADAFVKMAAETGCVAVARNVYEALQRLPRPIRPDPLGKIQISVCDWMEPGTMMAIQDFAKIPAFDLTTMAPPQESFTQNFSLRRLYDPIPWE